jgi:hypothetical protein
MPKKLNPEEAARAGWEKKQELIKSKADKKALKPPQRKIKK